MELFKKNPFFRQQAGFTLIEVLISITVLAFITLSTYTMINNNTDTKDRVIKEDRNTVQGLTAIGRLDSDISQMYNPLYSSSKAAPSANVNAGIYSDTTSNANGAFEGKTNSGALIPQFKSEDKSTIIFLTQANRRKIADSKESRFAWVKYSLRAMEPDTENPDDKSGGLYELIRQSIATDIYNTTLNWDTPKPQVVMEKIKDLEFSFWNEKSKKYSTSLQELNENKNLLRSIKIAITWIDDDSNEQKLEKTFRVLNPYFNTKLDEIKNPVPYGDGGAPPNTPDPNNPVVN